MGGREHGVRDGAGERGRGQGVNERAAHSGTVSGQWEILSPHNITLVILDLILAVNHQMVRWKERWLK